MGIATKIIFEAQADIFAECAEVAAGGDPFNPSIVTGFPVNTLYVISYDSTQTLFFRIKDWQENTCTWVLKGAGTTPVDLSIPLAIKEINDIFGVGGGDLADLDGFIITALG